MPTPNPKRVEAGRRNRRLRGELTEAGRDRLRQSALRHRPWTRSTGPKTPTGKARAAANGKVRQTRPRSVREARADAAETRDLIVMMQVAADKILSPGRGD